MPYALNAKTAESVVGLALKVDKEAGKSLSTNDYTTVEQTKLAAITGTNTGDQDLSGYVSTIDATTALNLKVDKVTGKGLSTNDYTTAEQTKLAGIATGAEVNVKPDWSAASGNVAEILNKPTILNSQWTTTGSDVYYNTGNVGIGTPTPTNHLEVHSTLTTTPTQFGLYNDYLGKNTSGSDYEISTIKLGTSVYHASISTKISNDSYGDQTRLDFSTPAAMNDNTQAIRMSIMPQTGNVGIGTTTPLTTLQLGPVGSIGQDVNSIYFGINFSSTGVNFLNTGNYASQLHFDGSLNNIVFKTTSSTGTAGSPITWVERMRIASNGNVGIGTASPQAKLQVDGTVIINNAAAPGFYGQSAGANRVYLGYDGAGTGLELYNFNSSKSLMVLDNGDLTYLGNVGIGTTTPADLLQVGNIMIGGNSGREIYSTTGYDINYKATGVAAHHFYTNGTEKLTIQSNGYVGIGTTTPSNPLHMASGAHVTGIGVWANASDARLKTNVVNTAYGLSTVLKLRPVNYTMVKGGEAQVGFLAQEVQKIVPEVVSGTEGDISKGETLGLSYGNLVPVLTKAIQEQQATIDALQKANEAQQKQIDEMKKMVEGLMKK